MTIQDYEKLIVDIPDYPEPGIIFKDVTPLMADSEGFVGMANDLADHFRSAGVTKVVGAEARGFVVGAPIALSLGVGFVPARKPGKLPREVFSQGYDLEYGTDELQIHRDALKPGDKVLIADDLVATAGTAVACAKLVEQAGAELAGFAFVLELAYLHPREIIEKEFSQEIYTLVKVQ